MVRVLRVILMACLVAVVSGAALAQSNVTVSAPVTFSGTDFAFSGGAVHLASGNSGVIRYVMGTATTDTMSHTDGTVQWNSSAAADKNETIPACTPANPGERHLIVDGQGTSATYPIVVSPPLGTTIAGVTFTNLSQSYGALAISCDGVSNWIVLNSIVNIGVFPVVTVPTNAALAALPTTTSPNGVWRIDYAVGNGAPPLFFKAQSGACTHNDGGSCVNSSNGNSWAASVAELDWREFGTFPGLGDNQVYAQAALDAGYRLNLPVLICGPGFQASGAATVFKTNPIYYHSRSTVRFCPGTVLQRLGAFVLGPSDVPGNSYPQAQLLDAVIDHPTIDMNASLMTTTGGAGIVVSALYPGHVIDPEIWNIPTRDTPAPTVTQTGVALPARVVSGGVTTSGPSPGTWGWTNFDGSGWAENGGIVMLATSVSNSGGVRIEGGHVGNFVLDPTTNLPQKVYACGGTLGAAGLVLTAPSQSFAASVSAADPPNNNEFDRTLYDCDQIGVRLDYGTGNRFVETDATFDPIAGYAIGSKGRYDVLVRCQSGSSCDGPSGTAGVTFMQTVNNVAANGTISTGSATITMSSGPPAGYVNGQIVTDDVTGKYLGIAQSWVSTTLTLTANAAAAGSGSSDQLSFGGAAVSATGTSRAAIATGLATAINASAPLAAIGVTATVWPSSSVLSIHYGDEYSASTTDPSLNIAFCPSQQVSNACTGGTGYTTYSLIPWYPNTQNKLEMVSAENGNAAIDLGANVRGVTIDNPQQVSQNTCCFVNHPHGGPDGAQDPVLVSYFPSGGLSPGTPENSNFTADCLNDQQPYIVNTPSIVTATLSPTTLRGTICKFQDAAGNWATHNIGIAVTYPGWGSSTIKGSVSNLTDSTAWDAFKMVFDFLPQGSSTVPTAQLPINNGMGDLHPTAQ